MHDKKLLEVTLFTLAHCTGFLVVQNLFLLSHKGKDFARSTNRRQFASFLVLKSVQQYPVFYIMSLKQPQSVLQIVRRPQADHSSLCLFSSIRQPESCKLIFRFPVAPNPVFPSIQLYKEKVLPVLELCSQIPFP